MEFSNDHAEICESLYNLQITFLKINMEISNLITTLVKYILNSTTVIISIFSFLIMLFVFTIGIQELVENIKNSNKEGKARMLNNFFVFLYFIGLCLLVGYTEVEDKYFENSLYFFGTIFFSYALIKAIEKQSVYIKDHTRYINIKFFILAPVTSLIISSAIIGSLDLSFNYFVILAFFNLIITYFFCIGNTDKDVV